MIQYRQLVRNLLLLLGMVTAFGLLSVIGGSVSNRLPHYDAVDDRVGSLVMIHVVTAIPAIIAATVCGALASLVFAPRNRVWPAVALVLILISYASTYAAYWRQAEIGSEDIAGICLAVIVLTLCYASALVIAARVSQARAAPAVD